MLVLVLAVLLLVVAPGLLLFVGRAIQRATDRIYSRPGAAEAVVASEAASARETEDAWYRRGMLPAFYHDDEDEAEARLLS